MASTYTTGFGIEKIGSGEQAGAWGTTTNHNADILDRIASYKAVALSGTTHTLTVREASPGSGTENLQDGMYRVIKFTGALGGNNTVTIAPNTSPAYFIIENATTDSGSSGPYSVILTQGSGANVTVQNGKNAIIYCDGAGSGAVVYDALADIQVGTLEVTGVAAIDGALTAAAISATTLTTSGIASIDDVTDTTSGTTGSIHTDGGLGVAKNLFVATNATVSGTTLMTGVTTHGDDVVSDTDSTDDLGTTSVRWANLFVDGITATDQITATGFTGTLDGILGSGSAAAATVTTLVASGIASVDDATQSTSTTTGSIHTDGGLGVVKDVFIGGALSVGGAKAKVSGKETIWVPAAAMYPSTTNPCSDVTQVETTALRPDLKVLDFATGADEFAQFAIAFPKSWNEGTVSFQPYWTVTGTNTGTVAWQLGGVAVSSDDTINTAFGTLVATTALAHSGTSNDLMVSVESGAVTIAGSPAVGDECFFQLNRDVSADTQSGDARLLGIKLLFTTDAANDA